MAAEAMPNVRCWNFYAQDCFYPPAFFILDLVPNKRLFNNGFSLPLILLLISSTFILAVILFDKTGAFLKLNVPFVGDLTGRVSCEEHGFTSSRDGLIVVPGRNASYGAFDALVKTCSAEGANFIIDGNTGKVTVISHKVLFGDLKITRDGKFYLFPYSEPVQKWNDKNNKISQVDPYTGKVFKEISFDGYSFLSIGQVSEGEFLALDDGNFLIGANKMTDQARHLLLVDTQTNVVAKDILMPQERYTGPFTLQEKNGQIYAIYLTFSTDGTNTSLTVFDVNTKAGIVSEIGKVTSADLGVQIQMLGKIAFMSDTNLISPNAKIISVYDIEHHELKGKHDSLNTFPNGFFLAGRTLIGLTYDYDNDKYARTLRILSFDAITMKKINDQPAPFTNRASLSMDSYGDTAIITNGYGDLVLVDLKTGKIRKSLVYTKH